MTGAAGGSPWNDVLAALHAVVYGYGVAGARLAAADRAVAYRSWERHRTTRDELVAQLVAAGAEPVQSAAAYELPFPVAAERDARELLVTLEDGLAAVWAAAVAATTGPRRGQAVRGLRTAAVAAARWRGSSVAFPGLPERY